MNSVWQQLTLTHLPLHEWSKASYLGHWFGLLRKQLSRWRQSSVLMQYADLIGTLIAAAVYGLAPFVADSPFGNILLLPPLVACAAFWLLLTLTDESGYGFTPIHVLVFLYWGVSVVSTVLSPVRSQAMEGLLKLTLYIMMFALLARVLRSPRLRSLLITSYLHIALIVSVVGVRQWFFGAKALATWVDAESPLAKTTRVYSFLGNPNLLAAYLLPACIFSAVAIFAWKGWIPKALAVVMTLVNSACLVLTFSRGGWLGFVAAGFVLMMLLVHWWSIHWPRFWRVWALPLLLGLSATLLVGAVMTVEPLRERVGSIFAGREDSSNNFRLNVWAAVQEMIRDRPILGIGPGNDAFNAVYPRYQRTGYTALSAYSIFLEILVETGIVGLACFLWLLLVLVHHGWAGLQRLRKVSDREGFWLIAALATLAGMLVHGLVDTVWYRPQISTLWWMTIAIVASYYSNRAFAPASTSDREWQ
jgi:putative inorganic carbon (HCO3(-)) transporter